MPASAVERLASALEQLAGCPVELERPSDPAHGDYATNAALRLAPARKRAPRELAEELAAAATGIAGVERVEVAGPGFLNLWLEPAWYGDALAEMLAAGDGYGGGSAATRERVQVEMVSANPTGPITVASARNGAYGDSVARLLAFAGHDGRARVLLQRRRPRRWTASAPRSRPSGVARSRPRTATAATTSRSSRRSTATPYRRCCELIEATLERFRIHFDTWERQSAIEAEIPAALERLDTYEAEGAVWARTTRLRRREGPGR